mgnify:CR=1 FL=1
MESQRLSEVLGLDARGLAELLGIEPEQARQLAQEKVYADDLTDAFQAGTLIGTLCERYDIVQVGRLIGRLQRAAGQTWVRF